MIIACPYCGHDLAAPLKDGIGSCHNCSRVFDTCPFNRLLSACWYIRRHSIADINMLEHHGIEESEGLIALALTYDGDYSHEEIVKILKKLGISESYGI